MVAIARPYTQDQYAAIAMYDLNNALTNGKGYQISQGFTNSTPLINCSIASKDFPVIIFQQGNYSGALAPELQEYPNDYCVIINYDSYSTLFSEKDALMFYGLGILK
jgi:hypothetical protein